MMEWGRPYERAHPEDAISVWVNVYVTPSGIKGHCYETRAAALRDFSPPAGVGQWVACVPLTVRNGKGLPEDWEYTPAHLPGSKGSKAKPDDPVRPR